MNKGLISGLVVLVLLLMVLCGLLLVNYSKRIKKWQHKIEMAQHHTEELKINMIDGWILERETLNMDRIVDEDGKKIDATCFPLGEPVLLFRFSKVDCSDCVVQQIDIIKELIVNSRVKYMMICNYANKRNLGMFKRVNAIHDQVYDCDKMLDGEQRTPYCCIYRHGIVTDVFFPDDDFPELTKSYFETISAKYFSK
jgi:hypothetical protein